MTTNGWSPGARDFDFLHGSWHIANERLVSRLTGSEEWERFEAEGICDPILGGIGNIDDFRPRSPAMSGFVGASLRIFDPSSGLWRIFWADNVIGNLTPPVVGRFNDGEGEFFGDDEHQGAPVRVRFRWSAVMPDAPRWEQAFSADGGTTWETNWTMAFTRAAEDQGGLATMAISVAAADMEQVLADLGNVPAAYQHEWRVVTPMEPLVRPGAVFKWYHVHRDGKPVAPEIDAEARAGTTEALAAGAWDPSYGLNFAILHVSMTHAFLLLGVWRGHQELWERNYARELVDGGVFSRIDASGEDAPVGCVWEMAATCHERMAWHRYLFSGRSGADKRAWLDDVYAGQA